MTKRVEGGVTYDPQTFDAQNRLVSVNRVGAGTTTFAYDAAGIRVKAVKPNRVVIDHPFSTYEVENPSAPTPIRRSIYSIAGQTVATRVSGDLVSGNNGISYFYNDHPGSNTALRRPDGSRVSTYYLPFGSYRGAAPTQTITDRGYTGHKHNDDLGLIYMNARFFVVGIGRFASADTLVPDPTNPQQFNRYSYVLNNPLRYSDPTGHVCYDHTAGPDLLGTCINEDGSTYSLLPLLHFTGSGWTQEEKNFALQAANDVARRMAQTAGGLSANEVFRAVFGGPITINRVQEYLVDNAGYSVYAVASETQALITVGLRIITNHYLFVHEIFHIFDLVVLGGAANRALDNIQKQTANTANPFPDRPGLEGPSEERWGFAGGNFSEWQKSRSGASGEEFADMGIGWTYNQWELSRTGVGWAPDGQARADFMNVNMAIWLTERIP